MVFAAKLHEVPNWGKKPVRVAGRDILLVNIKGEIHACESECPHQGVSLTGAFLKDAEHISCQRHGYRFNLRTGECREFPQYKLKIFPVQVIGEDILVEIE